MATITLKEMLAKEMPPWLSGPWGTKWTNALGAIFDTLHTETKNAVKERFILECSDEAVVFISNERQIEQSPGESIDGWRSRTWAAWDTWKFCGVDYGVYRAFEAIGWTPTLWLTSPMFSWPTIWSDDANVWIASAYQWTACPDGDDVAGHGHRFWVLANGYGIGYTTDTWGDPGTWGDGGAWSFANVTADEVDRWIRNIRKWKHSSATCPAIYMAMTSGDWPPTFIDPSGFESLPSVLEIFVGEGT
jgi:hypothetical protein